MVGSSRTSAAWVVNVRIVEGSRWPGRSSTETTTFVANLVFPTTARADTHVRFARIGQKSHQIRLT